MGFTVSPNHFFQRLELELEDSRKPKLQNFMIKIGDRLVSKISRPKFPPFLFFREAMRGHVKVHGMLKQLFSKFLSFIRGATYGFLPWLQGYWQQIIQVQLVQSSEISSYVPAIFSLCFCYDFYCLNHLSYDKKKVRCRVTPRGIRTATKRSSRRWKGAGWWQQTLRPPQFWATEMVRCWLQIETNLEYVF